MKELKGITLHKKKILAKVHEEAVKKIAEKPEILGVDGLNSETLLCKPFIFPEIRKKGQETGDLIFLYSPHLGEWKILVIELQIGFFRSGGFAVSKLEMSRKYFKNHWREWFHTIKIELPPSYSLWLKPVFVSYAGKGLWEKPFVVCLKETRLY